MKPEMLEYWCDNIENIEKWNPEDSLDVDFYLTLTIGNGQHAGDNFTVHVVTPRNIRIGTDAKKYLIVLPFYSWQGLMTEINSILEKYSDINWFGMQEKLVNYFHWEYQGMVPPYKK